MRKVLSKSTIYVNGHPVTQTLIKDDFHNGLFISNTIQVVMHCSFSYKKDVEMDRYMICKGGFRDYNSLRCAIKLCRVRLEHKLKTKRFYY